MVLSLLPDDDMSARTEGGGSQRVALVGSLEDLIEGAAVSQQASKADEPESTSAPDEVEKVEAEEGEIEAVEEPLHEVPADEPISKPRSENDQSPDVRQQEPAPVPQAAEEPQVLQTPPRPQERTLPDSEAEFEFLLDPQSELEVLKAPETPTEQREKDVEPVIAEEQPEPEPEPEPEQAAEVEAEELSEPEVAAVPVPRAAPARPKVEKVTKPAKQEKSVKPSKREKTARPAKQAKQAGSKKNSVKGASGTAAKAKPATAGKSSAKKTSGDGGRTNYLGRLKRKLQNAANRSYPNSARRRGIEGTAAVTFKLSQSGGASSVRLRRSSGNKDLDAAAVKAVSRAAPFGQRPASMGTNYIEITVPILFQIR
nr:energy transducer TonB [Pseudovibrio flavus]